MRIVAGKYGSRKLVSPKGDQTRPTSDKVKGAIFSSLGNLFDSGRFLDCYSGTGNMALEAISRGMDYAVLIDSSPVACRCIKQNIAILQAEDQTIVLNKDVFAALPQLEGTFDLIYIDPPYAKERNVELMQALCQNDLISEDGVVVVESVASQTFPDEIETLYKYKEKKYRDTKITMYKKKG